MNIKLLLRYLLLFFNFLYLLGSVYFLIFVQPSPSFISGGLEPLFGNKDSLSVELTGALTPAQFLLWVRDNLLGGDKKHDLIVDEKMFALLIILLTLVEPASFLRCSRPGIIYLINDADYSILEEDFKLSDGDEVAFISTIHGG